MGIFWKKPLFWIVFFLIILIIIPLSFYFFKDTILFFLSSNIKTQTPVEIKAGSCLILEEQFCSKAEVVEWTNPDGEKSIMIGFKLPAGTPLLLPIDGNVSRGKLSDTAAIKGFKASVADPNNPNPTWYDFYGDIEFDTPSPHDKSKRFGQIGKAGIQNAGGYNLLFGIQRGTGSNTTVAEDLMREMFSNTL